MAQAVESENVEEWGTQLRHTLNKGQKICSRNSSFNKWTSMGTDNVLTLAMHFKTEARDEDDESLKWAALERLPTFDRLRTSVRKKREGGRVVTEHIDVRKMDLIERKMLMESLVKDANEDNEMFLRRLRNRIDNVDIELPTVEVRFENLILEAKCHVGQRALPSLWNVTKNFAESLLDKVHLISKKQRSFTILKGVSGIVKPCRMTLLLGPPSSGKTSLLLALAGKLDPTLKKRGSITYNGHALHEFVPQKTSAYISQDDLHIGEMTVRETLDFSALSQGVGSKYDMMAELARREKRSQIIPDMEIDAYMKATSLEGLNNSLQTDYTLKILGLDTCSDTMIGNPMRRGVSGGQRKRVTTGEMIVGPTKTLFMDEISNGLDSSTTFHVVKSLQQFVHVLEGTILMSLLQPQPETFELFDDVILLSEGQIIYHGPRENVLEFFENCGFKCPPRKSVADFLQEVASYKDQKQYWAHSRKHYKYVSALEFAEKLQQSRFGIDLADKLAQPYPKDRNHGAALAFHRYSTKKLQLLQASFAREWILIKRNSFIYIFKGMQLIIVACVAMTVFLRTRLRADLEDGNYYLGALFFSLLIITFNGFAEISLTIMRLPVFFKQRDLLFYPAWAYTLPSFIMRIPQSIIESGLWVSITYFMIGFAPEPSRFLKQYLLLFLMHQMSSSIFRLIGGICQTMDLANTGGSIVLLLVFMLGGFIIPRGKIPKWWIWGYWVSPLAYAETAITVNEFLAPRWNTTVDKNDIATTGMKILVDRGLHTESYYYWIGVGALIGFILIFNILLTMALSYFPAPSRSRYTIAKALVDGMQGDHDICKESLLQPTQKISIRKALSEPMPPFEGQMHHMENGTKDFDKYTPGVFQNATVNTGMSLPFTPLSISFENVQYFVDMPKEMMAHGVQDKKLQLLRGVTGSFRPGVLTALMGVSGAGKTTLMDVLAGRKTGGYIEGDIRISGHPKLQETFARISGYCEQTDIHSPQVTVHESLIYSAWLRLSPDIKNNTRMDFVDEVMGLVELDNLSDALVGLPGISGLSTEQRKRLTIAVELVANPSIIFMDEPTSGLDARAAAIVMRAVRNTVNTGRTVVCTIHQPSIDIFEAFDELLLMKRGGQVIYAGPLGRHSQKVIEYFEAFPGVPKIKPTSNPATWMLEITSNSAEQRLGIDFAALYKNSQLSRHNAELVKRLNEPDPESNDLFFPTRFCQTFYGQFRILLWKQHLTYWRSPGYNLVRFSFTLMSALMFGTLFWQLGNKIKNQEDLLTIMGAMYGATLFLGINNCSTVQPIISVERTVFYRERAAGMYSAMAYASSQVAIECPYVLAQSMMYAAIVYSMMGFQWAMYKVLWFLFTMFCTFLYFTYYGMMAVSITPSHQVATIVASAFYAVFNLFSGFLMPRPNLPHWWSWYYWLCPTSWTLSGLITSQYGDRTDQIECMDASYHTIFLDIRDFLNHNYGFHHDFLGHVAAILIILPIFFALLFAFFVKTLNFQRR